MRIVFAVNGAANAPINQTALLASARYRGLIPAGEMQRRQIQAEVCTVFDLFRSSFDPSGVDLLILHQPKHDIVVLENVIGQMFARLDTIRRNGGVIVIDVSDFKFGEEFRKGLSHMIGAAKVAMYDLILRELFARCSAISTPTENLAELMRRSLHQPVPVYIVDDLVEVTRGEPRFAPSETLNMLWFGQMMSHAPSLQKFVHFELPQITKLRPAMLQILCEPVRPEDVTRYFGTSLEARGISFNQWSVAALNEALAGCDLVVLPVDTESMVAKGKSNNRILQSLYAGRYVVGNPLDSFRKLGDFVGLDRSILAGVAAALADPAGVTDRIRRGQEHIERHYTPAAIADRWLAIYRELTATPEPV